MAKGLLYNFNISDFNYYTNRCETNLYKVKELSSNINGLDDTYRFESSLMTHPNNYQIKEH